MITNDQIAALTLDVALNDGIKDTERYALGPGFTAGSTVASIDECNLYCMVYYDIYAACYKIVLDGESARFTTDDRFLKIEDFRDQIVKPLTQKVMAA